MGGGNTQQTETSGWAPAMGHGENILGLAENIFNQQMGTNVPQLGQITGNNNLNNAWAQMGGSGMNNLAQQMGQAGAGMMSQFDPSKLADIYGEIGKGSNMYDIQNMRDTLYADNKAAMDAQNASIMADLNKGIAQSTGQIYGAAAGGGNVGSSRTQLASGQAAGNLSAGAQATMAGLNAQALNSATDRAMAMDQQRLQGLAQEAAGMMGMAQAGQSMLGQAGNVYQQGIMNQLQAGSGQLALDQQNAMIQYQNQMNQYNKPQQLLGWYNQMVSPWVGAGSTTTTQGPDNTLGNIMNMAVQLGSAALMSDERLKKNIRKIGESNGINLYSWEWNENAEELKSRGYSQMIGSPNGVLAQEVQKTHPEAVFETKSGYLGVDYSKLPI